MPPTTRGNKIRLKKMACASFIKKQCEESCELVASIGETSQASNDTSRILVKFFSGITWEYWFLGMILLCCTGLTAAAPLGHPGSENKKKLRDEYLKMADLLVKRASHVVAVRLSAFKKVSRGVCTMPLGGIALGLQKKQVFKKIDSLVVSKLSEAHDLLDGLLEYYKMLFMSNCLCAAFAESFECGQAMIATSSCFSRLFDGRDFSRAIYRSNVVQQQANFIKAAMELVAGMRSTWWRARFARRSVQTKIDLLLARFDHALPECSELDDHVASTCHRCCALHVFQMINQGCMKHRSWKDPADSYILEKIVGGCTVAGCAFAVALAMH